MRVRLWIFLISFQSTFLTWRNVGAVVYTSAGEYACMNAMTARAAAYVLLEPTQPDTAVRRQWSVERTMATCLSHVS